jgi:hypothetical protein
MNYLLIELYKGKSRYLDEGELQGWIGNETGTVGPDGVRVWISEEHIVVQCPKSYDEDETFTEDEINDAHGWR